MSVLELLGAAVCVCKTQTANVAKHEHGNLYQFCNIEIVGKIR